MRIIVKRAGGYAGAESVAEADTSRLDAAGVRRIEQLINEAAVATGGEEAIGADLMRYTITIQEGERTTRSLTWTDDGNPNPGPVKRLIDEVGHLSRA